MAAFCQANDPRVFHLNFYPEVIRCGKGVTRFCLESLKAGPVQAVAVVHPSCSCGQCYISDTESHKGLEKQKTLVG